jgi:hypothetical protein
LGVQSCALQVEVAASQNSPVAQVMTRVEVRPSLLQVRTAFPSQYLALGVHSNDRQAPALQICPVAAQLVPPGKKPDPSALHVVATPMLQADWPAVHTFVRHVAPAASQY